MDKYKYFGDLSEQEQQELKTAHLLGIPIEEYCPDLYHYDLNGKVAAMGYWYDRSKPKWHRDSHYRVKPDE